jgi:hypothetical protein
LGFTNFSRLEALKTFGTFVAQPSKISGAVAGEKEVFCEGSLTLSTFLFCFSLAYFTLLHFIYLLISKIEKK